VVGVCCIAVSVVQQPAPGSLLSRQRLEEQPSDFFEMNEELDVRQRQIDEARAQLLLSAFPSQQNKETKGMKQSLYMETDAAPSGAMLQEYWKDFSALPPSHRPGLGTAASPDDIDARIRLLRKRSAHLRQVTKTAQQRAAQEEADDEDDFGVSRAKRGLHMTKLEELSHDDELIATSLGNMANIGASFAASDGSSSMAGSGTMAGAGTMAGGGSMAKNISPCILDELEGRWHPCNGNMATRGLQADGGHMFNHGRMASRRGLQASSRKGLMAGNGLLSGTGRILAGDGILTNDNLLVSPDYGMSNKAAGAPRLSILAQQKMSDLGPKTSTTNILDDLPIPDLEYGSTTPDIPFPTGTGGAENKGATQTLRQDAVWVNKFVPAWRPWLNCASDTGPESKAVCRAMKEMGERGDDGMGSSAQYVFQAASPQVLRETEAKMGAQQRLASRDLASALEPLNAMQAHLNLQRLQLVRGLLLPELQVEGQVKVDGAEDAQQPVMMVEEGGRMVRAVLYTDISNGSDGGFNAPYDLNGDGQYVDNWAKVSTDWSYTQPTGGYLSPMPGSNPGPDSMGGRPMVTWKSSGPRRLTKLTGNVPAWTQSPWLSVFSDASARKVRDSSIMAGLGLDLTDTTTPADADSASSDIIPDYQRVAAKNSPAHVRFQFSPPRDSGAQCNTLTGEGCKEGARQGASVTGTPLYVEYHPMRLVPQSKFVRGLNVEDEAAEKEEQRAKEEREEDHNYLNDDDFPKNLEEFDAARAANAAAEKAARSDIFRDQNVPQGRSSWNHMDTKGEYDKDLEEENHLNVVASAMHPEMLRFVGGGSRGGKRAREEAQDVTGDLTREYPEMSKADRQWQDYLFNQRMEGRYIMSNARAPPVKQSILRQVAEPTKMRRGEEEEEEVEPLEEMTQARTDEEYDSVF